MNNMITVLYKNGMEGIKELSRVVILGVVSWLLTEGILGSLLAGFQITPEMRVMIIAALTAILKSIDKWLHETGKDSNNNGLTKGMTRF